MLNEKQAWRVVERFFSGHFGMCSVIEDLRHYRIISAKTWKSMTRRIEKALKASGLEPGDYLFDPERGYSAERIDFCQRAAKRSKGKRARKRPAAD